MSEISNFLKDSLDIELPEKEDPPKDDLTVGYWGDVYAREMSEKVSKQLDEDLLKELDGNFEKLFAYQYTCDPHPEAKDTIKVNRVSVDEYWRNHGYEAKRSWSFQCNDIVYKCYLRLDCDIHWVEEYPDGSTLEHFDNPENFESKFWRSDIYELDCIPFNIRALLPQYYFDKKAGKLVAKTYSEFADVPANFGPGVVPEMPEVTVGAINHCKKADGCSLCLKAGEPSNMQRQCKFWSKATFADRCMHLRFDEFCDCMEAQKDA